MKFNRRPTCSARGGFNRFELIALIAAIGLLTLIAIIGSGQFKEKALRAHCRANLGQIAKALSLYAADSHGLLPDCSVNNRHFYGPQWPWDMHTNLVDDLMQRGAVRAGFYCPANPGMNDDSHWDFWRIGRSPNRVVGYPSLLYGIREIPAQFSCRNLQGNNGQTPAKTELTMDATMSMDDDYSVVTGLLTDRSNHLRKTAPLGGNISFEDGHAEWRNFKDMQHRFSTGNNVIWDF